jgi:hypothetical protein
MPRKPCKIKASEKALEVADLVQPNSVSIGLKKTPNELKTPKLTNKIIKAATTTI